MALIRSKWYAAPTPTPPPHPSSADPPSAASEFRLIYVSAFKAAHATCARSIRIYTSASVLITANDARFVAADR